MELKNGKICRNTVDFAVFFMHFQAKYEIIEP